MVYDPSEVDLVFMAQMLGLLTEGGLLVFPSSGLIYKVSHDNKTLTLQNVAKLSDPECKKLHEMTAYVASFFMYEMREATQ